MITIKCVCLGNKPVIMLPWQCGNQTHRHDPNLHSHVTVTQTLILGWVNLLREMGVMP